MKNENYEEIILTFIGSSQKLIDETDNKIKRKVLSSFSAFGNAKYQIDEVALLCYEKKRLEKLKFIVDRVFERLTPEEVELFNYKYLHKPVREDFDYKSRTYFRKQKRAISRFKQLLNYIGLTKEVFFEDYGDISFVKTTMIKCTNRTYNTRHKIDKIKVIS